MGKKFDVNWAEGAHHKCRHINKKHPTGYGHGQSFYNFSGYFSETHEEQDELELCVKLQDCHLTQMTWAGWDSSHSCSTVMDR